jgi:hypothetical protein
MQALAVMLLDRDLPGKLLTVPTNLQPERRKTTKRLSWHAPLKIPLVFSYSSETVKLNP